MTGKRRKGTTGQSALPQSLGRLWSSSSWKLFTGTWGTWTPKVSSSLIFFLVSDCFASFTNARWLWPVLLSVLFMRKRRNSSKHLWLSRFLWITPFSLSKLFLRHISLWGSRWANMLVKFVGIRGCINSELWDTAVYWAACWINFPVHYLPVDVTLTQKWCNKWARFLLLALKKCSCIKSLQSPPRKFWLQREGSLRKGTEFSPDSVFSEDLFCALWTQTESFLTDVRDFTGRNCQISVRKAFSLVLLVSCIHARQFCCKKS